MHKSTALASHSQNYVQKIALIIEVQVHQVKRQKPQVAKRHLNPQQLSFDFENYICPNCQLPFGCDCKGICYEPHWLENI